MDHAATMLGMSLFRGFTPSGAQRLIDLGRVMEHGAGEQLCNEGDPAAFVLLVLSRSLLVRGV